MIENLAAEPLFRLRSEFRKAGHDLRFVGGCVRDVLQGVTPSDIDLHTDATPDQQKAIYDLADVRYYETGIAHGTLTVQTGGKTYEVTTLRRDVDTDGRRATVEFTRDWRDDLARRDLTINAMSMSLEGVLNDPFGGEEDLRAGRVRFVGDAVTRIQEDYLRILRFMRFRGRYATGLIDVEAVEAIQQQKAGLRSISAERVWSELAKIIGHESGPQVFRMMSGMGLWPYLRVTGAPSEHRLLWAHRRTRNPVTLMTAAFSDRVVPTGQALRWSNDEQRLARFLVNTRPPAVEDYYKRLLALDRAPRDWVIELALLNDCSEPMVRALRDWDIPECPVTGDDLIARGMEPGPKLGQLLGLIRTAWALADYGVDKDTLLLKSYKGFEP